MIISALHNLIIKSDQGNVRCKSYQSMIQLITWSIVGDDTYIKIYTDLEDNVNESTSQQQSTSSNLNIPTLPGIARKVTQIEDLKQKRRNLTVKRTMKTTGTQDLFYKL